jgi:hypothetical protein
MEHVMRKIILAAITAGSAMAASPAFAQSASGTVNVTGTVASKCTASAPITGSITLNELAVAAGTVDAAFSSNSGGLSRSFTVKCTSSAPSIQVSATPLALTPSVAAATGYTGTVHYTATLTAAKAGGGAPASTAHTTNAAAPAALAVGDRLANATNNVTVAVSNGFTSTATDLLEAGSYQSTITITVSP